MYKDINKLSGHYIICGAGRIGAGGIRRLTGSTGMAQMLLRPAVADFLDLATMTERLETLEQMANPGSTSGVIRHHRH